jgi:magnesium transporter
MSTVRHILADPVTRHVRTDPTRLRTDQTVAEALESVRASPPSGRVIYFYVVDEEERLKGVVPTRRLLLANPAARVSDIMVRQVIAIPHTATVLEACEFFTLHKLLAFPVVDDARRVIGLVDVDLYTAELGELEQEADDVIRQEAGNDLFQLIGVHLTEAEQRRPAVAFRRRFPWLLANVAGGMLAALLADAYEDVATLAVVTPFIPVVLALSESVAIQSVSLALQTLHGERPSWGKLARKVGRELVVGLLLGAACGLTVGLIALAWKGKWEVGLSLFVGIGGGVLGAAGIGLAMPMVLKLLKRDPQVASGPIALATADMLTLLLYFNLGRWLLVLPAR